MITSWLEVSCPNCKTLNWINNGDLENFSDMDAEGFACWQCHKTFSLDGMPTDDDHTSADPIPSICTGEDLQRIKRLMNSHNPEIKWLLSKLGK
jgi:hypothetical protein